MAYALGYHILFFSLLLHLSVKQKAVILQAKKARYCSVLFT